MREQYTYTVRRSNDKRNPIRKPTQKAKLSRELIVDAAIALADKQGLDALSMRILAKHLGFGVMSLYNHVKDKSDLFDAMAEAVTAEIEIPAVRAAPFAQMNWRADLQLCTTSAYKQMLAHSWLPGLWSQYLGYSKNRYHNAVLRVMRNADFSAELSCRGFHALTMHVVGFASQVLEMPFTNKREFVAFGKQHLKDLEQQELPFLMDHVRFHLDGKDKRSDFKYMLELILDGLERDLALASSA